MKTLCASPFYVSIYYSLNGKTMAYTTIPPGMRNKGITVMGFAGVNKDVEMVRWLHCEKQMPIALITDVRVLHELVEKMFREENSAMHYPYDPGQASVAWAESVMIDNNYSTDPPVFQAELVQDGE